jgi:hypothetical protein
MTLVCVPSTSVTNSQTQQKLHSVLWIILFILTLPLKKLLPPDFLRAAQYRKFQENIQSNKYNFLSPKKLLYRGRAKEGKRKWNQIAEKSKRSQLNRYL